MFGIKFIYSRLIDIIDEMINKPTCIVCIATMDIYVHGALLGIIKDCLGPRIFVCQKTFCSSSDCVDPDRLC